MKDITVFGAGAYGQEICCLIHKINERSEAPIWNFIGFIDDDEKLWGTTNRYGKVLGGIDYLVGWKQELDVAISIANATVLQKIVGKLETNPLLSFPNLIDPDNHYLDKETFSMGKGNIVGEITRFAPNITLGNFNIIVNDGVFGHDDKIGDFNVFFPAARLSGHVTVGNNNTFGVMTTVIQGFKIGNKCKFAPGTFVMGDTEDGFMYRGNPARKVLL
jgi:acetyltransferase-like isoleucine patch superfamily enzyme